MAGKKYIRSGRERRRNMASQDGAAKTSAVEQATSPWDAALSKLREWDPAWAEQCVKMTTNPWTEGVLRTKFIELVCIGLNTARTNLNPDGMRRHIRAAIAAGANREEILFVLKCASVMSIHSCSFAAPILLEEAGAGRLQDTGAKRSRRMQNAGEATADIEKMKAIGQWDEEWDPLLFLSPVWTDQYMAVCGRLYATSLFPPKELELLCIALDASYTHMYGPDTKRHIKNALRAGATIEEIMEVLKLCVIQGVQACSLGVPILADELESNPASQNANT
jgi:alkylhydroperoxidase/carboxymuconolactone decarboxylase family protein YurZ